MENNRPLTIQSDRTMLLDVHSPYAKECREDIIAFADLIKSPEHIHTYSLSNISLWNAISSGISAEDILNRLKKWSRFDIDQKILYFIEDQARRFGDFVLEEFDEKNLILKVRRKIFFLQLEADRNLKQYLQPNDGESFLVDRMHRGTLKIALIKLGFPVEDRIKLSKGTPIKINKQDSFNSRDYQDEAVSSLMGKGELGTGFGTIVLPCGSGKTIVGILSMLRLKTRTLILCPNVASVHQWIREIKSKTDITDDMIGEYSGERKEIKPITVCTYQVLTWRPGKDEDYPHFSIFRDDGWGLIIYDEVHMLPAPVFRITAELQAIHRIGLTATLVREDGREDEVFSLVGPKRYDTPWAELAERGFIAKAYCHEIRIPLPEEDEVKYALASKREKFRIASCNKNKIVIAEKLIENHSDDQILIIGQYLEQLDEFKKHFGYEIITGTTSNKKRDELYSAFREKRIKVLIVSKVANFAIDLPDASVAIQVSGTFGSRQEEAQRLGRILRPKARDSHFYSVITEYTEEEDFATNRQKFLSEQGYNYSIEKRFV